MSASYQYGATQFIWQNPANFNTGGMVHMLEFTAAPTATSVQFHDGVSTAVSDASLQAEIPGYAVTRKTYFLGGSKQTQHLLPSA